MIRIKKKRWLSLGILMLLLASGCALMQPRDTVAGYAAGGNGTADNGETTTTPSSTKEVPGERVKLSISTYYLNDQVKTAANKYEELHPNIDIELQAGLASGKDMNDMLLNQEKYTKTTTASLLAGKGPDLIETDLFPAEKFVNRGLLSNLDELIKKDAAYKPDDYFAGIIDHSKIGGGLYGIPLYFTLVGLYGDADAISGVKFDDGSWTLDEFIDTAKELKQKGDRSYAYNSVPGDLLLSLANENYAKLVTVSDKKASFDQEALADMMKQVKALFDEGVVHDIYKENGKPTASGVYGSGGTFRDSFFTEATISSAQDFFMLAPFKHTNLYSKPKPKNSEPGGQFSAFGTVGINASSTHKQEAWDFLKFMMTDESVQAYTDSSGLSPGLPISKANYGEQIEQLKSEGTVRKPDGTAANIDDASLAALNAYILGAANRVNTQSTFNEIVRTESKAFFNGQKSAADAARLVQSKMNLYLNE